MTAPMPGNEQARDTPASPRKSKPWLSPAYLLGLAGAWVAMTPQGQAGPDAITLKEALNQSYTNELVGYAFEARKGECVAESIQLTGPRGPMAAQLTAIEYWPGKTQACVKSARLCFVADELAPLSTGVYTVAYGRKPAPAAATDLKVKPGKGSVEIATAQVGVILPLGEETPARPLAAQQAPGPLLAMRLGAGAWAGGSSLTGGAVVVAWKAVLTDQGPVLARGKVTYTLADSNVVDFSTTVVAGDNAVRWDMSVRNDQPDLGVEFRFPPLPGVKQALLPKGYGQWAKDRTLTVTPATTPLCFLSPDSSLVNINPDCPPNIRLCADNGQELQLRSRDPGAWVDPVKPLTYGGFPTWNLDMIQPAWAPWRNKRMPVGYGRDGTVTLGAGLAKGRRRWLVGAGNPLIGDQLDWRKDLVLDWPVKTRHPHVYFSPDERKGDQPEFKATPEMLKSMRERLAMLGNFDVFRQAIDVAALYDAVIDTDWVSPADRAVLRAQMAYLGYILADPMCWSMERGYLSGNPNMSVSYTLSLGIVACLLPEHPQAKAWADYCDRWMDKWLADEVGIEGEWLPEGDSYGGFVTLPALLAYALAARRAGHRDFCRDPRFHKLILFFARQYLPPDPRHGGRRLSPPVGRAHGWQTSGYLGLAAKVLAGSNPRAARFLQWLWSQGQYPMTTGESRLGPFAPQVLDKGLPAEAPQWPSALFPALGPVLRHGFNTPSEHYLNILSHVDSRHNLDVWTPCVGGINTWFAYGAPVSVSFDFGGGYAERHELLRDGVLLARWYDGAGQGKQPFGYYTKTRPECFTALPAADYVRASYTITEADQRDWFPEKLPATPQLAPATGTHLTWTRQLLFLKDPNPAGPTWALLRDTTAGGQPTAWQFWALSEKIGTPDQVADRVAFLADKPGKTQAPARELTLSDRYTALGQLDVDVDFFVAAPSQTPRATFRYGGKTLHIEEYQDVLQLRLSGDGAYCVAVCPRPRSVAAPAMTALANGKLIEVAGAFGTDYAFLSHAPDEVSAKGLAVKGTAASVQERGATRLLALGAPGEIHYKGHGLAAAGGAGLQVLQDALLISVPASAQAQEVKVTAAGKWSASGAKIKEAKDHLLVLSIPAGATSARLVKR
jgi:hypothetical protein